MSCCNPIDQPDLNFLLNQANSIIGGCYPTPTFASGGSYSGVLLTGSAFTVGTVTGLPTPTLASDAATKSYADSKAFLGVDIHTPVHILTFSNITLVGGAPSIYDTYYLSAGSEILVNGQSTTSENGIYYVSVLGSGANGTWLRRADANATGELQVGAETTVRYGATYGGSNWVMSNATVPVIGSDPISFTQRYALYLIPASKISGQITDSQISDVSAAKITGTLGLPYSFDSSYNKIQIQAGIGLTVGGVMNLGQNGANTGVHLLLAGNGHQAELNAVQSAVQAVTLVLRSNDSSSSVILSSAGTISMSGVLNCGGVNAGSIYTTGTGQFITSLTSNGLFTGYGGANIDGVTTLTSGNVVITTGDLNVNTGKIQCVGDIISSSNLIGTAAHITGTTLLTGNVTSGSNLIHLSKTITPSGTTGAQTINSTSGSVNFAAGITSLVVTNFLSTTQSVITTTKGTNDGTARLGAAVAAAGSFTIYMDVAPAAECRVNFEVTN
jgi:hypothetical protein